MDGIKGTELTEQVAQRLRDNSSRVRSIQVLADFCHVTSTTAAEWMGNRKPLGGLPTLHLWHFLDTLGVDQPELTKLRRDYPFGAYIGELLAYGVVSMNEAREFGINPREPDKSALGEGAIFRAARGEGRISKPRYTYDELVASYGNELAEAKQRLQGLVGSWRGEEVTTTPAVTPASPQPPTIEELIDRLPFARLEEELARLIEKVSPPEKPRIVEIAEMADTLLTALATANRAVYGLTPAERSQLRDMMGDGGMFRLSNVINMLCSERAREKGIK